MVPSGAPLVDLSGPWCWLLLFLWFSGQVHPPARWCPAWACFAHFGNLSAPEQRHPGSLASLRGTLHYLDTTAVLQYILFSCFILAHICRVLHCFMQPIHYCTRLFFSCTSKPFNQWDPSNMRQEGGKGVSWGIYSCLVPYNIILGALSTWPSPSGFQHPLPPPCPIGPCPIWLSLQSCYSHVTSLCKWLPKRGARPAKSVWSSRDRRADPRPTESESGEGAQQCVFQQALQVIVKHTQIWELPHYPPVLSSHNFA